ncbi:MAG: glycosyltransferase family protein [Bacteroidales bacterium]|nr:glycosyltransferase family protein [Bacteroidales bacterium]
MKASIIIQARMSSTRLPGKVMMKISGKPLIGHMILRLEHCKKVDNIIVATSKDRSNDPLCKYLSEIGINAYRGDEENVLSRFYYAALQINAKNVVRLTADCPLIDPIQIDKFIQVLFDKQADYVFGGPSFAEGLDTEVFTFNALKKATKNAMNKSEREHVTLYFHNNNESFNIIRIDNDVDDSNYRITVDEKEDFIVVNKIFEALYNDKKPLFGINQIKNFLNENPDVFTINSRIIRNEGLIKSLKNDAIKKTTN